MEVRRVRDDYLTISRTSADGSLTIYGATYAASGLGITVGGATFTLPPDCLEIRLVECITSGYEGVRFQVGMSISDPDVQAARYLSNQPGTNLEPTGFYISWRGGATADLSPLSSVALALRWEYVSSTCIETTAGVAIRAFTTDSDELTLPHPCYLAVEEVATARAQMQDQDPMFSAWTGWAQASVAKFIGSSTRQSMDVQHVRGVFE